VCYWFCVTWRHCLRVMWIHCVLYVLCENSVWGTCYVKTLCTCYVKCVCVMWRHCLRVMWIHCVLYMLCENVVLVCDVQSLVVEQCLSIHLCVCPPQLESRVCMQHWRREPHRLPACMTYVLCEDVYVLCEVCVSVCVLCEDTVYVLCEDIVYYVSLTGALYCENFVLSVFLGDDIVPRLSISSAFDLKIRLLTTLLNCDIPKVFVHCCAYYFASLFLVIFVIGCTYWLFRM